MLGNGSYKLRSLKAGTPAAREVNPITQFCFAMELRELAKLILGKAEPREIGEGQVLTSGGVSSLVIDSLCDRAGGENATIACFYFDFAAQNEQSPVSMLGSLLKQLVCGQEEIPEEISRTYQSQKNAIGRRGPRLSDILKMLQTTSSKTRTLVCIDALDECAAGHRVKILDSLSQILQKSPGTRIFMTGRPHILPEIGRRLPGRTSISISPKRDDIITYLHARLAEDTTPDAMDSALEAGILKKIPEDISEMYVEAATLRKLKISTDRYLFSFLLVSLNIDAILQEPTIHRRRQKLSAMTDGLGLGDAYDATLGRIKGQGGEKARLGMAALMWISHSERPLRSDELCHALAIEIGLSNLNSDNVPSIGTVLACCQGLAAVDKKASTVRLIHFTLHEYLRAQPELFSAAHSTMVETCLSYLNSQEVKALSTSLSPDLPGTPFLEYSSLYWGMHARRDLSDCAKLLVLKLFDDYSNHISTKILLRAQDRYSRSVDFDEPSLFSGLHCASIFGIVEILANLVEVGGCDINQGDCVGNTPLVWASWNGWEGVVKILLGDGGANPNKPDRYGHTPLCCAVLNGHEEVVKILLEREDVDPNKGDKYGQTPLYYAARNGHEGVVRVLLARDDVDPNKPNKRGQTPLCCAAWSGCEGVVKILLGRDGVNPGELDIDGKTPLSRAARNGHEGVVKILLRRESINPNKPDSCGQTLLCCAAWSGHEGVVKILLEREDVNPDKPGNRGQTPLCCAAQNGHERVVKTLLKRGDVSPDRPDNDGRTPLCCAAQNGHERVVKMLLERGDIDPNKLDNWGRGPLFGAARGGHEGVMKILLERGDVNPNRPNNKGQTPLWWATKCGHAKVVALLHPRSSHM